MSSEKKPKYIKIRWNGWDTIASLIDSDEELDLWLKDGSLEEGDTVFEVNRRLKVITKSQTKLGVKEF